jgi:type IV secretion system protein VirD4
MIQRPLMTPDELKTLPKGSFIVAKTGACPMKTSLKLFIEWGIRFEKVYELQEKSARKVAYADKKELEEEIVKRHISYEDIVEQEPYFTSAQGGISLAPAEEIQEKALKSRLQTKTKTQRQMEPPLRTD